ncbi:MAG: PIG-L family deacetylase [Alphaproteobacteria bacterium]|nr:PIG-L family deacetylase [Alphaproteobacteria bacterium]
MSAPMPLLAQEASSTTFFTGAHPDDWQLFETPNAINDVRNPGNKTVFIYLTAGDNGCGTGCPSPWGNHLPYYQVRELGAQRSIRFVAMLDGTPAKAESGQTITINQHHILRYVFGHTVQYYFRLPDGNNIDGTGYPATGNQSLLLLHQGAIKQLTAIDGSAVYTSWAELVDTFRALIISEATGSSNVWMNTQDPDSTINPGDHPDHYQNGMAMQEAVANLSCVNEAFFTGYAKAAYKQNVRGLDFELQTGTFAVIQSARADYGVDQPFLGEDGWLGRNYYRVVLGSGSACHF